MGRNHVCRFFVVFNLEMELPAIFKAFEMGDKDGLIAYLRLQYRNDEVFRFIAERQVVPGVGLEPTLPMGNGF